MATKKNWNHKLRSTVTITASSTKGEVMGRAQYVDSNPSYLVRYCDGTGTMRENWMSESALDEKSVDAAGSKEEE